MMSSLASPIKSPNDKKLYRVIELPNGLKALLISNPKEPNESCCAGNLDSDSGHASADEALDSEEPSDADALDEEEDEDDGGDEQEDEEDKDDNPKEKMAAAGLCINVGSFSDPPELQGLAHYLEHMVFMGSEKYPDENSFSAFMKKRSGSENACTDCERTVFKLEIHPKHFHEALDRLAQFFISPLMKKDSMDRELEAVDSEFNLSQPQDGCRRLLLFGGLSKEGSPMRQFMWGNSKTLKVLPEANGIDVYSSLREFWSKHYSAQFMTLAVQSTETLDTLQEWVTELFSAVPNNQLPPPSFEEHLEPFKTSSFHKLYKLCPVKKTNSVFISWSLPCQQSKYKCKPLRYLGYVVGDEGRGSLLALLRKKAWALSLECGNDESGTDHNSIHAIFTIKMQLTDAGMDNLPEVLNHVFQYLDLVRNEGPQQRFFEELKVIRGNAFKFQEEIEAEDYAEALCEYMQLYPPEHYIVGRALHLEYDADAINACTQLLTPETANFMVQSTRFMVDAPCNLREKWTQMAYSVEDIPSEWLETWKHLPTNPHLHLPLPNCYIATDFEIKPCPIEKTEYPTNILENEFCRLYYKKDNKFKVPKASLNFRLLTPLPGSSPKNEVLTDLMLEVLDQCLSVEAYPARVAYLSYEVHRDECGLVIKLHGFNHKLPRLLETILHQGTDFNVEPEIFEGIKKQLMKSYFNQFNSPGNLCRETRLSLLVHSHWTSLEKRAVLPEITLPMVQAFAKELLSNVFVEGLIQGNILPEEAIELIQLVYTHLKCSPLPKDLIPQIRVSNIPVASSGLRVASFNKENTNCVIANYYQIGPGDINKQTLVELFTEIIEEPSFDTLRTKEQLGYRVGTMMNITFGILGYSIAVHCSGDKFSCSHVDSRIECFLDSFIKTVAEMSKEEFDIQILSLVRLKQCEDLTLTEEVNRNWTEVTSFEYVFDRLQRQVAILRALELDEFKFWVANELLLGRKKLSTQVVGCGQVSLDDCKSFPEIPVSCEETDGCPQLYSLHVLQPKETSETTEFFTNISSVKAGLPVYPVSRICE